MPYFFRVMQKEGIKLDFDLVVTFQERRYMNAYRYKSICLYLRHTYVRTHTHKHTRTRTRALQNLPSHTHEHTCACRCTVRGCSVYRNEFFCVVDNPEYEKQAGTAGQRNQNSLGPLLKNFAAIPGKHQAIYSYMCNQDMRPRKYV